ncbi:hypothetical protein D3C84_1267710 [compost metagenome]
MDGHQLVVGRSGLIDFNDGKLGGAGANGGFARGSGEGRGSAKPPDQKRQQGKFWT